MSSRKVKKYVEARRELVKLRAQLAQYPEELTHSEPFRKHLREAELAAALLVRTLTGGELGRATRELAALPEEAARLAPGEEEATP